MRRANGRQVGTSPPPVAAGHGLTDPGLARPRTKRAADSAEKQADADTERAD